MNILLTFTGFHDPFTKGLIGDEEHPGPILSLINSIKFEQVFLFSTPRTLKNTSETENALKEFHPGLKVRIDLLDLVDPIDYFAILKELRAKLQLIQKEFSNCNFYISVSSGTPQMHACWLLLAASGEILAKIINIRPPQFVTKEKPLIYELNLLSPEFPIIKFPLMEMEYPDSSSDNMERIIKNSGIVGEHPLLRQSIQTAINISESIVPVLIYGETGTGKELFAKLIHHLSKRKNDKFIPVNCAAIPNELIESTLFGHKKGAFTGALQDHIGKFVQADNGTLFLDEIGEMPVAIQAKLLRVLQDKIIEPVGSAKGQKVDIRIIAATNKNLPLQIKKGLFREDLYYRINVCEIKLPSLKERRTDIPTLALSILNKINLNLRFPKKLSISALKNLQNYNYPGNVRELENIIERAAMMTQNEIIDSDDIVFSESHIEDKSEIPVPHKGFDIEEYFRKTREELIYKALKITDNNQSEASRLLGISPQAINKFLKNKN